MDSFGDREADAFPETQIWELHDRSFTLKLLERVGDHTLPSDKRENLGRLLATVEDPRVIVPALAFLESTNAPDDLRNLGASLIESLGASIETNTIRRWYASNDELLRRGAVLLFGGRMQADLIADALESDNPQLREQAVSSLFSSFEEPHWQQRAISCLHDEDAAVRASAATVLLWNEPNAAEEPLIRAVDDLDDDVACEAINSLRYFASLRVMESLFSVMQLSSSLRRAVKARESLTDVLEMVRENANHSGLWFDSVRAFVERYESTELRVIDALETVPTQAGGKLEPQFVRAAAELHRLQSATDEPIDVDAMLSELADPDGFWAIKHARLHRGDPHSVVPTKRTELINVLISHPDIEVRSSSARYLAAYGDAEFLLKLLDDPQVSVRKSAIYYLHDVEPSAEVAERVIARVRSGELASTQAHEAMRTWGRHRFVTAPAAIVGELLAFTHDLRESVRCDAVEQLISHNAEQARERFLVLLAEPPIMTWAVHTSILSGYEHVGLTKDKVAEACAKWFDVDNLWIQVALAPLCG
jgi:hypothetical protein